MLLGVRVGPWPYVCGGTGALSPRADAGGADGHDTSEGGGAGGMGSADADVDDAGGPAAGRPDIDASLSCLGLDAGIGGAETTGGGFSFVGEGAKLDGGGADGAS